MRCIIIIVLLMSVTGPACAGLYPPNDPRPFPISEEGSTIPLPFDEFRRRMAVLGNVANPARPTEDRQAVLDHAAKLKPQAAANPQAALERAIDLLRLRDLDGALNLLQPFSRARQPQFVPVSALAHVHAARGEWREAVDTQLAALIDAGVPPQLPGYSPAQRNWTAALEDRYLLHYLRLKRGEAATRPNPETEGVLPLFPAPEAGKTAVNALSWRNEAGQYEPGQLAAAERALLPADALAVVQQLCLWFPDDVQLIWLLGELYAAEGKFDEALKLLDECAWSRQYSNRKLLMEHRAAVRAALEAKQKAERDAQLQAFPISWRWVAVYFIGVLALFAWGVARALGRKAHKGCGPLGCS